VRDAVAARASSRSWSATEVIPASIEQLAATTPRPATEASPSPGARPGPERLSRVARCRKAMDHRSIRMGVPVDARALFYNGVLFGALDARPRRTRDARSS
jgi:transposase InsO family protein